MKTMLIATALFVTGFAAAVAAQQGSSTPEGASAAQDEPLAVLPAFKAVDTNKDGKIEASETKTLAKMLEQQHHIAFQFDAVDKDRDGVINDREYVAYDAMLKDKLGIA